MSGQTRHNVTQHNITRSTWKVVPLRFVRHVTSRPTLIRELLYPTTWSLVRGTRVRGALKVPCHVLREVVYQFLVTKSGWRNRVFTPFVSYESHFGGSATSHLQIQRILFSICKRVTKGLSVYFIVNNVVRVKISISL